jgi:hypothetical protein
MKNEHVNLTDDLIVQVTITRTSSASDEPSLRHHQLCTHLSFIFTLWLIPITETN